MKGGRLTFDYNEFHTHTRPDRSRTAHVPDDHEIVLTVTRGSDGGGEASLAVDGKIVAQGARIPRLLFLISSTGMDLGRSMSPVNGDYAAPFVYPGALKRVTFETPQTMPPGEVKAQVRAEMTRQ